MQIMEVLAGRGALLVDFDGPICSLFAGYPASRVAAELLALVGGEGEDPLAILRRCPPGRMAEAEEALSAAERYAAGLATPTPFGHEVLRRAHADGVPIAVVSNNSATAIEAYLAAHDLAACVTVIVGRAYADPSRMKPDPRPVIEAVRALGADRRSCVLIGDSPSDIEAAHAAGVAAVGYANRPAKVSALAAAEAVVTSMRDVAEAWAAI